MPILTFGVNHKTAPLEVRETVAFDKAKLPRLFVEFKEHYAINEAVLLSTCNRTEIYCPMQFESAIEAWFQHQALTEYTYRHYGIDAVQHLLRVASGLDSMVLGEPQILGQLKQAYEFAQSHGMIQAHLKYLFPSAFSASKTIRSETDIGKHPISFAFAILQLAKRIFFELRRCRVLLVGVGETTELIATHLLKQDVKEIIVANRTIKNAEHFRQKFGANVIAIDQLADVIGHVDIIVSATSSPDYVIDAELMASTRAPRQGRPRLIVDMAVPRDVDPEILTQDDAYLYNIDDLQALVTENLKHRHYAAQQAEALVQSHAEHYLCQLRVLEASDMIRNFRRQREDIRDTELEKAKAQLQSGKDAQSVIEQFAHSLTNKWLHRPTLKMREAAYCKQGEVLILLKELYGL